MQAPVASTRMPWRLPLDQAHRLVGDAALLRQRRDIHRTEPTKQIQWLGARRPYRARVLTDSAHESADSALEIGRQSGCLPGDWHGPTS